MNLVGQGILAKMPASLDQPVSYQLPLGEQRVDINSLLGSSIKLTFLNKITCFNCGNNTNKSFSQGYCYSCFKTLAACDVCIMSPEKCHYAAGTCRQPEWGEANCFTEHVVYLANTSAIKVGITRLGQVPTRWIDQGATQALPIFRVSSRLQSGLLEVIFKHHVADKTNWRNMLKGDGGPVDMAQRRDELLQACAGEVNGLQKKHGIVQINPLLAAKVVDIHYPVNEYPTKVSSFNFDKTPVVEGQLMGIKGQYLILDTGVINIRRFGGYHVELMSS